MGKERRDEFVKTQISESFDQPIHRYKISTFKVMAKKTTTSNNKSTEVNRDILGRLLSISLKESKTTPLQQIYQSNRLLISLTPWHI